MADSKVNTIVDVDRMVRRMQNKKKVRKDNKVEHKSNYPTRVVRRRIDETTTAKVISEPSRKLEVMCECDVLVVGGGPAGLSAAVASARAGADTVLVERFGCFGGVITTVGMETLAWYRYAGTVDTSGIGLEMENMAARMGGSRKFHFNDSECLDAEYFKFVADELIRNNGIRPILHCLAVDTIVNGGQIEGIIVQSKSGRQAILAKRVVDCTGDADIAFLANVPCNVLPEQKRMSVTQVFNASAVKKKTFLNHVKRNTKTYADWGGDWAQDSDKEADLPSPFLSEEFEKAKKDGVTKESFSGSWSSINDEGEATNLNLVHMRGIDATNVHDLTRAEMEGRRMTFEAIKALKHTLPGWEKSKLRNFGMTIGVRDTRKIVARYELTYGDCISEARFHDAVGTFPEFLDGYTVLMLPTTGRYFQVPLACMVPKTVDNLLVAGRCVGGDTLSHGAMRNMMACCVTGQGAGVAAAVSALTHTSVHNVDIDLVQAELRKQGVNLNPAKKQTATMVNAERPDTSALESGRSNTSNMESVQSVLPRSKL